MGYNIFRTLFLILLPSLVWGQSMNISASSNTAGNDPSTFPLEEGQLNISSGQVQFINSGTSVADFEAFGISPDKSVVSFLSRTNDGGEITLFNSSGDTLNQYSTISLASSDPSQAVYPFNAGHVLIRNNITNFTFYDTFGEISTSMSSSSQSKEGEAISEIALSDNGSTLVIYNPKIKRNGDLGSKATVRLPEEEFESIFSSNNRFIKDVRISEGGGFIGIVTSAQGSSDQVLIVDKYGNELNRISAEEVLSGITFSEGAEYITLYSQGRVMVYSTLEGNRLGSTSIRSSVFEAKYFAEDDMIVVLSGNYSASSDILNNVEFRAIDLEQRQIASGEYNSALGFSKAMHPRLSRTSSHTYELTGANKILSISVAF